MSGFTIVNCAQNVVTFCQRLLNDHHLSAIREHFPNGVQALDLEEYLQEGNYVPVLSAVWGESDNQRRVAWLRQHSLHVPLMFELAIAEFKVAPTADTISQISFPLIRAAAIRVYQDAQCSTDPSVFRGNAESIMEEIYQTVLLQTVEREAPSLNVRAILNERAEEISRCVREQLLAIASRTLEEPHTLPDPTWIAYDGLASSFEGRPAMAPSDQFAEFRKRAVQERLLPQLDVQLLD